MKTCSKCQIEKPLDQFYRDNRKGTYRPSCKPCVIEQNASTKIPGDPVRLAKRAEAARRTRAEEWRPEGTYIPRDERLRIAAEKRIARAATSMSAAEAKANYVSRAKPNKGSKVWYETATPEMVVAYRANAAAKYRARYLRTKESEVARATRYKQANPEVVMAQHARRLEQPEVKLMATYKRRGMTTEHNELLSKREADRQYDSMMID